MVENLVILIRDNCFLGTQQNLFTYGCTVLTLLFKNGFHGALLIADN